ncbi:MAG: TrmB family transcriptional regulator [Candidatus Hermodarchaeota archaeon]
MSNILIEELEDFLKSANLSNYEVNVYLSLLKHNNLTAREISKKSNVPIGRIYEILKELKLKGMIEVQSSRPKYYKTLPFNLASQNLISHIISIGQRKISYLYEQARNLESLIYNSDAFYKPVSSTTFWSAEFNLDSMVSLLAKESREVKEELLAMSILSSNIIKVISVGKPYFQELRKALNRGVDIKYIWSLEPDKGKLCTMTQINRYKSIYFELKRNLKDFYNLSDELTGFELRFISKQIPTNFNVIDSKRVIVKIQNPLKTPEILSVMNVLDPDLARELRKTFFNLWDYESNII